MEHVFAPIGFNWQICIALVPGMAAREVVVSSLATVYALAAAGNDADTARALSPMIQQHWSLATALSLLVWFIYAPQCLSTLAIIRRETNSMKQTLVAAGYLFALAYCASLVTYQVAKALGRLMGGPAAQYPAIALVVAVSAVFVMRRQFPNATRRLRIAIAVPHTARAFAGMDEIAGTPHRAAGAGASATPPAAVATAAIRPKRLSAGVRPPRTRRPKA